MNNKSTKKFGLLIVDDEKGMRQVYREYLSGDKGHFKLKGIWDTIEEHEDAGKALKYIKRYKDESQYHLLVITDAYMQPNCDGNGVEDAGKLFGGLWLINEVNKDTTLKDFTTIILTTYFDDRIQGYIYQKKPKLFNCTVEKDFYFVKKPFTVDNDFKHQEDGTKLLLNNPPEIVNALFGRIFFLIDKIINTIQSESPVTLNQKELSFIGNSNKTKEVLKVINQVDYTEAPILITGETGTGKEVVAKKIHYGSFRANQPLVAVNCAAIPENLFEAELFGYDKGAFTGAVHNKIGYFERAEKGTIFLDEIGEMSLNTQVKLLRVLRENTFERVGGEKTIEVDVRIIAATNRDLEGMISAGLFREDLYYRLRVIPISLSPLRERKEDIPLLIEHFLKIFNKEYNKSSSVEQEAMTLLTNYHWPGNVGELKNITESLVLLSKKETIHCEDVNMALPKKTIDQPVIFKELIPLAKLEKIYYQSLLDHTAWNKSKAAKIAGVHGTTITSKINEHNLVEFERNVM